MGLHSKYWFLPSLKLKYETRVKANYTTNTLAYYSTQSITAVRVLEHTLGTVFTAASFLHSLRIDPMYKVFFSDKHCNTLVYWSHLWVKKFFFSFFSLF
jgi:hypothetical protein